MKEPLLLYGERWKVNFRRNLLQTDGIRNNVCILSMIENTHVKDHVDSFNRIVIDIQFVGVSIEEEDQASFLYSFPYLYEHFVDTMLYGRDSISVNDVKDALRSRELKKKVSSSNEEESISALAVSEGKSFERDGGKGSMSRSKSKSKGRWCYYCKKKGHFRKDCPRLKKGR